MGRNLNSAFRKLIKISSALTFAFLYPFCDLAVDTLHHHTLSYKCPSHTHEHRRCSRGVLITPDHYGIADDESWTFLKQANIIAIPGGAKGAATLAADPNIGQHIRTAIEAWGGAERRWVAAICAGTVVLDAATEEPGFWDTVRMPRPRVTSHPSVKEDLVVAGWEYGGQDERVVVDKCVITSRGPGTALAWALAVVEEAAGFDKRMEVQGPMMVATVL